MAGLLDLLGKSTGDANKDAALNQGLLQMGLSMLTNNGGNFGQVLGRGGMSGLQGYNQSQDRQFMESQQSQLKKDWEEKARQQAQQQKMRELTQQFYKSPEQTALAQGGGPTLANAQKIGAPSYDFQGFANALAQYDPQGSLELKARLAKPAAPLIKVGEGEQLYDPTKGTVAFSGSPKTEKGTSDMQNYAAVKAEGYTGSLDQFLREQANLKAPKNSVNVNMGQKGYENESKLRNDFKSEPIYKDFQDMKSAYSQIQTSLKQGTPIADTAAATKIMKLLDPGSVVRESELGIAMASAGKMDRLKNYFQMQMSGEKLTPTQRTEFGALADELYAAAGQAYNTKRGEYAGFGKSYGLNESVLGDAWAAPAKAGSYDDKAKEARYQEWLRNNQ